MKNLFFIFIAILAAKADENDFYVPEGDTCPIFCPIESTPGDVICHESCNVRECDWDRAKCVDTGLDILVHIESQGDKWFSDSEWAGTQGLSLRLEGFQISFKDTHLSDVLGIEYIADLEGKGSTGWMSDGNFVGTRGEWRRMDRFAIRRSWDRYNRFRVKYTCHIEGIGDSGTYSEGEYCGLYGKRVEAIYVWIQMIL